MGILWSSQGSLFGHFGQVFLEVNFGGGSAEDLRSPKPSDFAASEPMSSHAWLPLQSAVNLKAAVSAADLSSLPAWCLLG